MTYNNQDLFRTDAYPVTAAETSPENPWQIKTLSEKIKNHISRAPRAWVEGEIIQIHERGSATYLTLRDLDEEISLPLSIWGNILSTLGEKLEKGNKIVAQIQPDFWVKTGKLSMQTSAVKKIGIGDLLLRIEKLRKMLQVEGIFSIEHKKDIPYLPNKIGLITGKDSDAKKDVLKNAILRWPHAIFEIREVAVQGSQTVKQICEALAELDADSDVDVIVITRGGGSMEDLLPFSNEHLVRAVFHANTPVVSAIGHEADRPLLDEVADVRASTPTDAAKKIVPDMNFEIQQIANIKTQILHFLKRQYAHEREKLALLRSRPILAEPLKILQHYDNDLKIMRENIVKNLSISLETKSIQIKHYKQQILNLSPQVTLERGYAIVQTIDGMIVHDSVEVSSGSLLDIKVASGDFQSRVV